MSGQSFVNPETPIWAYSVVQDQINQLELTSAVASFNQTAGSILTWDETTTVGQEGSNQTVNSGVLIDNNKNISKVQSLQFTGITGPTGSTGPTGLYDSGGSLFYNGVNLSAGISGGVQGPVSSTDSAFALYNGTTGKIIKNSNYTIDTSGNINYGGSKYITHPNSSSQTLGISAGNSLGVTDIANCAIGESSLNLLSGGTNNTTCGYGNLASLTSGNGNTCIGASAFINASSINASIAIGAAAGSLASTTPLNNAIYIGNNGSNSDISPIKIGNGIQDSCYIYGINNNSAIGTTGSTAVVVNSLGQLRTFPQYYTFRMDGLFSPTFNATGNYYFPISGGGYNISGYGATGTNAFAPCNFNLQFNSMRLWNNFGSGITGTFVYQVYKNYSPFSTSFTVNAVSNTYYDSGIITQTGSIAVGDMLAMYASNVGNTAGLSPSQIGWELICTFA